MTRIPQRQMRARAAGAVSAALLALLCCAKGDYPRLYSTSARAPSFSEASVIALDHLGASIVDDGVNFGVYSENATRMELLLFDDPESNRPTQKFPMVRLGNVWNLHVQGVGLGQAYGYVAWGPNWPFDPSWFPGSIHGFLADVDAQGNRFNPNKLLFDPYSRAFTRDHDWSKGSLASGPARTELTYAAAAKSVVVQSQYQWSSGESAWRKMRQNPNAPGHRVQDLILYEVHPKGFTASTASAVDHPGTFRGIGEKADYFAELGITAVELLPVMQKPSDGGYWGYQTIGFFAPELTYSFDRRPGGPIDEFKWMVDQLHQRNIEVVLDVVFNHTGEGGLWREKIQFDDTASDPATVEKLYNYDPKEIAGLHSFRGLDNQAYYALSPDNQTYWNNTGVGDDMRCNHTPMRRLILDSLRYWASELHVDGFRFDLAPILGEKDLDYNHWDAVQYTVLQSIVDDPSLQQYNTRIFAEPWAAGGPTFQLGQFPAAATKDGAAWSEWNGHFRDWWRSFVNDDNWKLGSYDGDGYIQSKSNNAKQGLNFGDLITGSQQLFSWTGRWPYNSANFVTIHDGFTMYDLLTYNKQLDGCGPLNPVCCDTPTSPFCNRDSGENNNRSREWRACANTTYPNQKACSVNSDCNADNSVQCLADEDFKRQQMRNLFAAMLLSNGTPLLLGGDEWLRTQLGNNNAYSTLADNPNNWFDWGVWQSQDERYRMKDFVAQLTRFRARNGTLFAPAGYDTAAPFTYKSENNDANVNWSGKHLMLHYYDSTRGTQTALLINMENGPVTFTLPVGVKWQRVADTQETFDQSTYLNAAALPLRQSANISLDAPAGVPGGVYQTNGHTIVILQAAK